ncbi:hypothetical protein KJ909_01090 [Patescibacteria group bacterium]|nr:hypothetical protein [Patescibacteria group bacterium]
MPRASNLDTIAPDDLIAPPASPKPKPKKKSKLKKISPKPISQSKDLPYRQKVYQLIKDTTKTSFSSFLARPKVFTFDSREDDEEIILVLRRHWFTNLSWIIIALFMFLTPLVLSFFPFFNLFPQTFHLIMFLFLYLISFAIAFENFLSWYFNVFIITEERVIDIDFYNLIDKKMSEAKISMIQDITVKTNGVAQTLFNFGTILVQTAAEVPVITVEKVPSPNIVLQVLQQMRSEEEQEVLEGRLK